MVDIDLFKDDNEENDWKESSDQSGGDLGDDLGGDAADEFNFDDEFGEGESLDTEGIMDGEEAIPEFDESEESDAFDDYEYGDVKEKKTSPFIWVLLGIVIVFVGVYIFVIDPSMNPFQQKKPATSTVQQRRPTTLTRRPTTVPPSTGTVDTAAARPSTVAGTPGTSTTTPPAGDTSVRQPAVTTAGSQQQVSGTKNAVLVNNSISVLNELSASAQFGTLMMEHDRFLVQYVSNQANVGQAMTNEIKALLNGANMKVSPEDRQTLNGRIRYSGVVSGTLPAESTGTPNRGQPIADPGTFENQLKALAVQQQMSSPAIERFSAQTKDNMKTQALRFKTEGSKVQAIRFLNQLKAMTGRFDMDKLLIVPQPYSDSEASQIKLVLDIDLILQ